MKTQNSAIYFPKNDFVHKFVFVLGPIVAHILSSHYESYNLHIAELTNENGQVVWKASYVTIMIFMWLTLLSVNLYFNGLRYDIWNGVTVIAFVPYCIISLCYL